MTRRESAVAYAATAFHDQLRRSPGLSDAAVRAALILSGYSDANGRCWPSQRRVAADLRWSLRKVERTIGELQAAGLVGYVTRARHRGERSVIQLRTTVTPDAAVNPDGGYPKGTADKTDKEPPSDLTRTTVTDGGQNSPKNSPTELPQLPTGTESSAPGIQDGIHSAREIVAHAVTFARDHDLVLTANRRARLGKAAKELLDGGADVEQLLLATERLLMENKPPTALEYILGDIKKGDRADGRARGVNEHAYGF